MNSFKNEHIPFQTLRKMSLIKAFHRMCYFYQKNQAFAKINSFSKYSRIAFYVLLRVKEKRHK